MGRVMNQIRRGVVEAAPHLNTAGPADIVSFSTDMASPAKSLIVGMEPIQAGSGDPSPDNIRPISGHTGVTVERTGKNLFGPNASPTANAYIGANGNLEYATGWIASDYIAVPPDTELYFQPNSTVGDSAKTWFYDAEQNPISYISSGPCSFTTPSNCAFMRFSYRSASTDIMLNLGSTACGERCADGRQGNPYARQQYSIWDERHKKHYCGRRRCPI